MFFVFYVRYLHICSGFRFCLGIRDKCHNTTNFKLITFSCIPHSNHLYTKGEFNTTKGNTKMKKKPTGILTVRCPVELIEEVKAMAAKQELSVSEFITDCLVMGLEDGEE